MQKFQALGLIAQILNEDMVRDYAVDKSLFNDYKEKKKKRKIRRGDNTSSTD
jgi:hypothetical protein